MNALAGRALCWRLERRDGAGLALTSHDRALVIAGVEYLPVGSLVPGAVVRDGDPTSDASVEGAISADALRADDLAAGRWSEARADLYAVRWDDETAAPVSLWSGTLGEIRMAGERFEAVLCGLSARMARSVVPVTSPQCRADLGDRRCRVDLSGRRQVAVVTAVDESGRVRTSPEATSDHGLGHVVLFDGAGAGTRQTILTVEDGWMSFRDPWAVAPAPGQRLLLSEGCDKRLQTCAGRFANAANFRGEPHLPGVDLLTRVAGD